MPLYNWECSKCIGLSEVERKIVEIDIPPVECEHCGNPSFNGRVLVPPSSKVKGFILIDGGVGWPSHGFYG